MAYAIQPIPCLVRHIFFHLGGTVRWHREIQHRGPSELSRWAAPDTRERFYGSLELLLLLTRVDLLLRTRWLGSNRFRSGEIGGLLGNPNSGQITFCRR